MVEPAPARKRHVDIVPPAGVPLPPHPILSQYYANEDERRAYVRRLFDSTAQHYDWIDRVMSFGTGHRYRRQVLLRSGLTAGMQVLDVGCGTGVMARHASEIVGAQGAVVALDPSIGMLHEARWRVPHTVQGLGESLPFADHRFDAVTMGYALRHVADLSQAFGEYRRVLTTGGMVLLLEITPPCSRGLYLLLKLYMKHVVPALTGALRRSRTARMTMVYFWETIEQCVAPKTVMAALQAAGFEQVRRDVLGGVLSAYSARRT